MVVLLALLYGPPSLGGSGDRRMDFAVKAEREASAETGTFKFPVEKP
jgi:hypothetical protein